MKNIFLFIITFFVSIQLIAQQEVKTETLLTIGNNETVITSESRFVVSCKLKTSCVVTKDNDKNTFYVYQNGSKIGTFSSLNEAFSKCNAPVELSSGGSIYNSTDGYVFNEYLVIDNEQYSIKFNNKVYGPYQQVTNFLVSEDKQIFYALVRLSDLSQAIVSNYSKLVKIKDNISSFRISPTGKSCMVTTISGVDMATELLKLANLNLPDEEYQKRVTKIMEDAMKQAQNPSISIFLSNGSVFGPYDKETVKSNNPEFCKTGGDNWMIIIDNKLLINGKPVLDFKDIWVSLDDVWISADGSSYVYKTYDKLVFSDGKIFEYPLVLEYCKEDNGLVWMILENKSKFVKYSRKL